MAFGFTGEQAAQAMLAGLLGDIKMKLRARLLEQAEKDIEDAIDGALAHFKITVENMHDLANMQDIVKVILRDERGKP